MSLAAFEAMAAKWKKHCDAHPEFADVIDARLDKLDEYYNYAQDVPVNTIAMGKTARKLFLCNMLTDNVTVLNPATKLNWLRMNAPSQVEDTRQVVLTVVCRTIQCSYSHHYAHHYHSSHCTIDHRQVVPAILGQVAHKLVAYGHTIFLALACQLLMTSWALKMSLTTTLLNCWYIAVLYIIGRYVIKQWSLKKALKKHSISQENQTRYPTLFHLTMDILPIQGSAVSCERVFSSAKETMTMWRNHIGPDLMEALQILKFSVKHSTSVLNFTSGWDENAAMAELEKAMEAEALIPEDISSFIEGLLARQLGCMNTSDWLPYLVL